MEHGTRRYAIGHYPGLCAPQVCELTWDAARNHYVTTGGYIGAAEIYYATAEEAAAELLRRAAVEPAEARCLHQWFVVSHEEAHCTRCGAWQFIPDD